MFPPHYITGVLPQHVDENTLINTCFDIHCPSLLNVSKDDTHIMTNLAEVCGTLKRTTAASGFRATAYPIRENAIVRQHDTAHTGTGQYQCIVCFENLEGSEDLPSEVTSS